MRLHVPAGMNRKQPWNPLATPQEVVDTCENFLTEVLMLSTGPTKTWFLNACQLTFPGKGHSLFNSFAERFCSACSFCFRQRLNMTTGKRTSNPMKRLMKIIFFSPAPISACIPWELSVSKCQEKAFAKKKI